MTTSTAATRHTIQCGQKSSALVADVVDYAAVTLLRRRLSKVTDGMVLDREDAGARLSRTLDRRIEHRCSRSEHLFVDITTGNAVRLVVDRSSTGAPVMYMAQSPSPGTEPDLYQQLVDAAQFDQTASGRHAPGIDAHALPARAGGGTP
ncbi:MAG TPA: hypothetical protein VFG15_18825 [Amycolatopsis sp.]|nr:hypothetical protein [Amycolatopsis sp.]